MVVWTREGSISISISSIFISSKYNTNSGTNSNDNNQLGGNRTKHGGLLGAPDQTRSVAQETRQKDWQR